MSSERFLLSALVLFLTLPTSETNNPPTNAPIGKGGFVSMRGEGVVKRKPFSK